MHLEPPVAVHPAIETLRAEGEGRDALAREGRLEPVGDDARLDQREDAVTDHLRVDAEVLAVGELHDDGVGDGAEPDLDGRPVGDELGDVRADRLLDRPDLGQSHGGQRALVLDDRGDLVDVHVAVAEGVRHLRVSGSR